MKIEKRKIGNKEVMPFTIPSGIINTEVSSLEKIAREIPEIGILTTKSIGPESREGNREPILSQYHPECFINAVGLTNPGAEEFARKLSHVNFPEEKFLLASIFGKNAGEFVYVAKTLEGFVDGFELNLSCPHVSGHGMTLGQDPEIVERITRAVSRETEKPIFAKLTPNVNNIGAIAKAAISAGAEGIVAINTVGPGYYSIDGNAVLTNKVGGLSGIGITPIGLKCVRDIRQAVGKKIPIIAMGGIAIAKDIEDYASVGAAFFGIGSSLAGMTNEEIKNYFPTLLEDLYNGTNKAEGLLKKVDMRYRKVRIERKTDSACDMKIFKTNTAMIGAKPGQFVFAWIPEIGEKPFSIVEKEPLTLGVLERGEFTRKFSSLKEGNSFYVRGPYGKAIELSSNYWDRFVLVGGGCGIFGLHLIAKRISEIHHEKKLTALLGAKDKEHLPYLKDFKKYGEVCVATEDGSFGTKGTIVELFNKVNLQKDTYFFNCGPKEMINAILPFELAISVPERIYSSVDYITRCGVGICGSCADEKGRRTCVEGPFINP